MRERGNGGEGERGRTREKGRGGRGRGREKGRTRDGESRDRKRGQQAGDPLHTLLLSLLSTPSQLAFQHLTNDILTLLLIKTHREGETTLCTVAPAHKEHPAVGTPL